MRVGGFNVNQFDSLEHQEADLEARMGDVDVLLLQETVNIDLHAFAAKHPGWAAFQVRQGNNDGHANTGILYRTGLGVPAATDIEFLGDVDGTRARFLAAVELGPWFAAGHIFPSRDSHGIPEQLHNLGVWVKAHSGPKVISLDKNEAPVAALEKATGLNWYGVGIDGFLTNLPLSDLGTFAKGFSDHKGVHATVTVAKPKPSKHKPKHRVRKASALLKEALRVANKSGNQERASRIRRAINALAVLLAAPVFWFPAITAARKQSHGGPQFGVDECLQRVRGCYGIPAVAPDAIGAWNIAKTKHRETNPADIPRGFPVFWSGGSHGHGHIAISAGGGFCWSTDIRRPGFFDYVPITEIHAKWGLTLLGWTEDLNGRPIGAEVAK